MAQTAHIVHSVQSAHTINDIQSTKTVHIPTSAYLTLDFYGPGLGVGYKGQVSVYQQIK